MKYLHRLAPALALFCAALASAFQPEAALSAVTAMACVFLPQAAAVFALKNSAAGAVKLWAAKFALTLLLLGLAITSLNAAGMLLPWAFVCGVVGGLAAGLAVTAAAVRAPAAKG